jgi:hypothetical protein
LQIWPDSVSSTLTRLIFLLCITKHADQSSQNLPSRIPSKPQDLSHITHNMSSQLVATPSPPRTSHGQGQGSSPNWTSETPKTQHQLAKQSELIKALIQRASQSPTAPIEKLSKSCSQQMARTTLLERRVTELETTIEHLKKKKKKKKKKKSLTRLQIGGIMNVGDAQEMIREADLAIQSEGQRPRPRAPPTCSNCHQIGHTRTRCTIVEYSC